MIEIEPLKNANVENASCCFCTDGAGDAASFMSHYEMALVWQYDNECTHKTCYACVGCIDVIFTDVDVRGSSSSNDAGVAEAQQ